VTGLLRKAEEGAGVLGVQHADGDSLKAAFRLLPVLAISVLMSSPVPCLGAASDQTVTQIVEEQGKGVLLVSVFGPSGTQRARGSGFLVRPNGVFVTNYHVVERAKTIKVKLPDGREFTATGSIALEPELDMAVLKIDADQLPTVVLGDSDSMKVGERVVAVGSPLGLENSVTDGLLSAIRRDEGNEKGAKMQKLFQISTPISPGSSGGPLFNMRGQVIGITFASIRKGQNLNFAIPINYAKSLIRDGPVQAIESSALRQTLLGCSIIGNRRSTVYHVPGGRFYEQMLFSSNGVCFQSEGEAQRHGYRRSFR